MALAVIFVLCLLLATVLVAQISSHHRRLEALEMKMQSMDVMFRKHLGPLSVSNEPSNGVSSNGASHGPKLEAPLRGVRIGIQIDGDGDRPAFSRMLRDRLTELGAQPRLIAPREEVEISGADILIRGRARSAGYEDMFFEAILECVTPNRSLFVLTERPPHGDKLSSLTVTLVNRLQKEYKPHPGAKGPVYAPARATNS